MKQGPVSDVQEQRIPDDAEIGRLLNPKADRKARKRNDHQPSPRFPEALYCYLLLLAEAAVLLGVWGYLLQGASEVISNGPTLEAPVLEQIRYSLVSTWEGLRSQCMERPWIALAVAACSLAVFSPKTSRGRKRLTRLLSVVLVSAFALLIAQQFMNNLESALVLTGI